jgi:methyl-accepting chemotaxis protein
MRLTIKAKLAGAFGVIIVLSMITGVVAYSKLSSLDESQQHIVSQSARMTLAADVKSDIQEQQRAEIRMIQAFSDKETEDEYKSMMSLREKVRKQFGDLYSQTNESGKKLLDQAGVHSTISRISPAKWRC